MSYSREEAIAVDQELFNEYQFSVDQLMELAGHSVASIVAEEFQSVSNKNVLVCCGPGNNGGDGLVASRHLKLFGFNPTVVCLKPGRGELFQRLLHQVNSHDIEILDSLPQDLSSQEIILDAIFGFSYQPPLRKEYVHLLKGIATSGKKLVCVDIPSGWNVDDGPPTGDEHVSENDEKDPVLKPDVLISLTAPKLCAVKATTAKHFLAGRFVPPKLASKYSLNLPVYPGVKGWQEIKLNDMC